MYGQELQAESYAVAEINAIIHDMEIDLRRGDTMINPKFRDAVGALMRYDIVVANPMWNQPFSSDIFEEDPFDRFAKSGGVTSGKGDWAWLQHALCTINDGGRAAVVLDSGALTRGSGSKNEDKERNIRRWFVEHDLIDGVIMLPENLFYNTTAAGVIIVLSKRKVTSRKGKIVMLNAGGRFVKGKAKESHLIRGHCRGRTPVCRRKGVEWPSGGHHYRGCSRCRLQPQPHAMGDQDRRQARDRRRRCLAGRTIGTRCSHS